MPPLDFRFGWSSVPWYASAIGSALVAFSFYIFYLVSKVNTYAAAAGGPGTDHVAELELPAWRTRRGGVVLQLQKARSGRSEGAMHQVADWLEKLGLGQYAQHFVENDISFSVLPDPTDQDLEEIGVWLGHRHQFLRAIAELPSHKKVALILQLLLAIGGDYHRRLSGASNSKSVRQRERRDHAAPYRPRFSPLCPTAGISRKPPASRCNRIALREQGTLELYRYPNFRNAAAAYGNGPSMKRSACRGPGG